MHKNVAHGPYPKNPIHSHVIRITKTISVIEHAVELQHGDHLVFAVLACSQQTLSLAPSLVLHFSWTIRRHSLRRNGVLQNSRAAVKPDAVAGLTLDQLNFGHKKAQLEAWVGCALGRINVLQETQQEALHDFNKAEIMPTWNDGILADFKRDNCPSPAKIRTLLVQANHSCPPFLIHPIQRWLNFNNNCAFSDYCHSLWSNLAR